MTNAKGGLTDANDHREYEDEDKDKDEGKYEDKYYH